MFKEAIVAVGGGYLGSKALGGLMDMFGSSPEKGKEEPGTLAKALNFIMGKGKPETTAEAKKVIDESTAERDSLLSSIWESTTGKLAIAAGGALFLNYVKNKFSEESATPEEEKNAQTTGEKTSFLGGIWDKITGSKKEEAEAIKEGAETERANIFLEGIDLILTRELPTFSAGKDIVEHIFTNETETFAGQNWFETTSALLLFIGKLKPTWLKPVTDLIIKLPGFKTLVEYASLSNTSWTTELQKENPSPDAVIEMVRYLTQLAVTSGVGARTLMEILGGAKISDDISQMLSKGANKITEAITPGSIAAKA